MGTADQLDYKKVQVFEKFLNACTRDRIFLKTAFLMPALQTILSIATIKMFHLGQDLVAVMFIWIYLLALGFSLITFSAAANVYRSSQEWIAGSKGAGNKTRYERKFHKSLRPLRLPFGNNFVEVLTPLIVQEFCIRQAMSFLLVTK